VKQRANVLIISQEAGLGTWSLCTIYASLVASCCFLPTAVIKRFTVKWAMVGSMLCYSTYIAAQFYPRFWTLIPAAIILGMGAAPMWSAKCTYLTQVSNVDRTSIKGAKNNICPLYVERSAPDPSSFANI